LYTSSGRWPAADHLLGELICNEGASAHLWKNSVSTSDVRVTVGVLVFNGALTLRSAVESILNQSYRGFVIHISDDASRDASAEVGKSLAAEHSTVAFTQQPRNLGPANNFRFLLERATTEYFMWLAADDYLEPTYLARMITILDADPTLVACVSRVCFVKPDGSRRLSVGTYPLLADPATNLAVYLSQPNDNSRLYALYRTGSLGKAFPRSHFHAFDWAAVAGTLLYGKHAEVADVLMIRDETPIENYMKSVRVDNPWGIARLFPLAIMTYDLLVRQRIPFKLPILKALVHQNVELHLAYMRMFHPRYVMLTKCVWYLWDRYLSWRLVKDFLLVR
jgi:glycosyltransferase involved in cell wall biosynthesis